MKKLTLLLLFLFGNIFSFANSQYNTDSLWTVWENKSLSDIQRFDAMIELSWIEILHYRLDSAFILIEQLIEEARPKGYEKYESVYQFGLGYTEQKVGHYAESEEYFKNSIALAEEFGMPRIKNWSLMGLADTYFLQDKYDQSIAWYTRSANYADSINYLQLKALSVGNRGSTYNRMGELKKAVEDYFLALNTSRKDNFQLSEAGLYILLGNYYRDNDNNHPKALEYYLKGEALARKIGYDLILAESLMAIGRLHDQQEEFKKGLEYKHQTLDVWKEQGNKNGIMWTYNNLGWSYRFLKDWENASKYFNLNLQLAEETESALGKNYAYVGLGDVAFDQQSFKKALEYYHTSWEFANEIGSKSRIANSAQLIGKSYVQLDRSSAALKWCNQAYDYFKLTNVIKKKKVACQCLYEAHKSRNESTKALFYFEQVAELNDSLNTQEIGKKMQQMEFSKQMLADSLADVEEAHFIEMAHAAEINKKNQTRNILIGSGLLALVFAGTLWNRLHFTRKSKVAIQKEKDRSEYLLHNILPVEIATELKEKGMAIAREHDKVSILFTDFKGFTQLSEKLTAAQLVAEINDCFKVFDGICDKYQLEKIKTIGDAFMAAGGLPAPYEQATKNTILAALEMMDFIENRRLIKEAKGEISFGMRAGVHTGPVVAGIVGVKKFQYDVWGDTVNTASRMESSSEEGKVNISLATYKIIKDDPTFSFKSRGMIAAKGKGTVAMYYVQKRSQ